MSKGNKTKGVELLRIVKTLFNAGILTADEQIECVQLVKKGFLDADYYRIVEKKLSKKSSNSFPEPMQILYQKLLAEVRQMME